MTDQCNSSSRFLKWVRGLFWVILCIYGTVAALILGIRFILLPHVGDYKDDISGKLSERIGVRVHFDDIAPKWSSYWPILRISGLTVGDDSSRPQLTIEHAEARLSWTSFFQLSPNFQLIRLNGVDLSIARTGDASFLIGGIPLELSSGAKDSPVLNWLLNQGRIEIEGVRANYRDATQSDVQCSIDNASLSFIQDAQGWHAGVQGLFSIGETRSPVDFRIKNHSALLQTKSDWTHWRGSFFLKAPQVDAAVAFLAVARDARHRAAERLELRQELGELLRLLRASARAVLGIKVQDKREMVSGGEQVAVCIGQGESGVHGRDSSFC